MKIGIGESSFWYTSWVMKTPFCGQVPYVDIHDLNIRIKDVWDGNKWNLDVLYTPMPSEICNSIGQTRPWIDVDVSDVWIWKHSISGVYSVNDVYRWLMQSDDPQVNKFSWRWIWKLKDPANIQFFLWQLCHGTISTKSVLKGRGISTSDVCPVCGADAETIIHCLFSCSRAKEAWSRCLLQVDTASLDYMELKFWLHDTTLNHGVGVVVDHVVF